MNNSEIESLPVPEQSSHQPAICAVCLDMFTVLEYRSAQNLDMDFRRLPCGHGFHVGCVRSLTQCPTCRKMIVATVPVVIAMEDTPDTAPLPTVTLDVTAVITTVSGTSPDTNDTRVYPNINGLIMGRTPPPLYINWQMTEYHPDIIESMWSSRKYIEGNNDYEHGGCGHGCFHIRDCLCGIPNACGCGRGYLAPPFVSNINLKGVWCGLFCCRCAEAFNYATRTHTCLMCTPCFQCTCVDSPTFVGRRVCCLCWTCAKYVTPSETQTFCILGKGANNVASGNNMRR